MVPPPISPLRVRKREDYVPATEHEVLEWMADRQEDMTAALSRHLRRGLTLQLTRMRLQRFNLILKVMPWLVLHSRCQFRTGSLL